MNVNPFSYLIEKLKGKVDKSGDTMSGNLTVDRQNGTTATEGESALVLGNNIAVGTDKNSTGAIYLFKGDKYLVLKPDTLNANKTITLPNETGTIALRRTTNIPVTTNGNGEFQISGTGIPSDAFICEMFFKDTYSTSSYYGIVFGLPGNGRYVKVFNSNSGTVATNITFTVTVNFI